MQMNIQFLVLLCMDHIHETYACLCVLPVTPHFQKLREQLEGQITRLQQENGILRDAVSSATSQMETK